MGETGGTIGGRAYLVGKLRERGCSRRQAVQILNLILAAMKRALAWGQKVAFPFGYLERVRHRHPRVEGWFLNRNTAQYKHPYMVRHVVNRGGRKLLREMEEGRPGRGKRPAGGSAGGCGARE